MPVPQRWTARMLLMLAVVAVWPVVAQTPELPPFKRDVPPGDPPPVPESTDPTEKGVEILGRGPIHQGFAQPSTSTPRPAPVVPKAPPDPIREVPPEQKPAGDNVTWVPGYWAWDDDRSDYVWISGIWRVPPPGRKWSPGYWTKVAEGYRYVSGFWGDGNPPAVPHSETPPESLDRGPNVPTPGDDYTWVPGNWVSQDVRWLWQPGFWCPPRPGWLFNPACYFWTPRGCQFIPGFWDRCLETRGLAFAPVYFIPGFCNRPNFCFTPRCCLGVGRLFNSFWCRPSCGYYAFGDFYGKGYANCGFQPWFAYGPRTCDPLFGFYRNAFVGTNPGWTRGLASTFDGRSKGTLPLPPRTFIRGNPVTPVQPLANFKSASLPLVRVPASERTPKASIASTQLSAERARTEVRSAVVPSSRPEVATVRSAPPSVRPEVTTSRSAPTARSAETSAPRTQQPPRLTMPQTTNNPTPRLVTPSTTPTLLRGTAPVTTPRMPTLPREMPRPTTTAPRYTMPSSTPRFTSPPTPSRGSAPSGMRGGNGGKGR